MQFGKLIGVSLIILGLLLVSLQAWISFFPGQLHPEQLPAQVQQHKDAGHTPGIIGGIVVIVGFVIFAFNRRKDQDRPRHPVK